MNWFKRSAKKRITQEELVEMLYYFATKFTVDYVTRELTEENSHFKTADKNIFIHERLILIFWIIDAFFSDKERKLMADIHRKFFNASGIIKSEETMRKEVSFIMRRYEEYHAAYNKNSGAEQFVLGGIIAKNILRQDKPIMNILITTELAIDVMLIVKLMKESIFDQHDVI